MILLERLTLTWAFELNSQNLPCFPEIVKLSKFINFCEEFIIKSTKFVHRLLQELKVVSKVYIIRDTIYYASTHS